MRRYMRFFVVIIICLVITVAGIILVHMFMNENDSTTNTITTTTTTTTAAPVPTGADTIAPVEIYPDGNGSTPDDIDGGFGYDPIETPTTSATTTASEHNVQVTTTVDIFIGSNGDNTDPPVETENSTAQTTTNTTTYTEQTTAVTPTVTTTAEGTTAITPIYTTVRNTSSVSNFVPPVATAYVDPEDEWGENAHDYLE